MTQVPVRYAPQFITLASNERYSSSMEGRRTKRDSRVSNVYDALHNPKLNPKARSYPTTKRMQRLDQDL